jgi:hypothetical protein
MLMNPDQFYEEFRKDILDGDPAEHPWLRDTPLYHFSSDDEVYVDTDASHENALVTVRREEWVPGTSVDFYEARSEAENVGIGS